MEAPIIGKFVFTPPMLTIEVGLSWPNPRLQLSMWKFS